MDGTADAVSVRRRTVFQYDASKNDIVWGEFGAVRARLRRHLEEAEADEPLGSALRRAVVLSNRYERGQLPELRSRMALITATPALQGHSMLRYEEWRSDVAAFVAARLGTHADDLVPQAIAQETMATAMTAFRHCVVHPDADLEGCLEEAIDALVGRLGREPA